MSNQEGPAARREADRVRSEPTPVAVIAIDQIVAGAQFAAQDPDVRAGLPPPVVGGIPLAKNVRLKELDLLRAIAVLLVLGRHLAIDDTAAATSNAVFDMWGRCGWVGVDLFFVLSGFLVSGLIFREYRTYGSFDVKRFFVRRAFKIYPAFYTLILVTAAVSHFARRNLGIKEYLSEMVFVQNYGFPIWPHTWSLAVEEHFYLLIALLLLGLSVRKREDPFSVCPWIFLGVAPLLLMLRVMTSLTLAYSVQTNLTPTHLRIDSLLFGVTLAYFYNFKEHACLAYLDRHVRRLRLICVALIAPCLILPLTHVFMHTFGFTCLYLGFGGILLLSLREGTSLFLPMGRLMSPLAAVGAYSYSIYLWHMPVRRVVSALLHGRFVAAPPPLVLEGLVYVGGSIGVGLVMAKLIELPCLRLRDALFPSRSPRAPLLETVQAAERATSVSATDDRRCCVASPTV